LQPCVPMFWNLRVNKYLQVRIMYGIHVSKIFQENWESTNNIQDKHQELKRAYFLLPTGQQFYIESMPSIFAFAFCYSSWPWDLKTAFVIDVFNNLLPQKAPKPPKNKTLKSGSTEENTLYLRCRHSKGKATASRIC